jgi:hypothetical protein
MDPSLFERLVEQLNKMIDLPILNESQEGAIIRYLLRQVLRLLESIGIKV